MGTHPVASVGAGMPVNSFNTAFTNFTGYTPLPTQMPTYHNTYNDPSFPIGIGSGIKSDWSNLTGLEKVSTVGNVLGGAWNAYSAHKQLGMQKDAMNLAKKQWQMDWDAKAKITNSELADRQAKRHYSDSKAASVADYMGKYGI